MWFFTWAWTTHSNHASRVWGFWESRTLDNTWPNQPPCTSVLPGCQCAPAAVTCTWVPSSSVGNTMALPRLVLAGSRITSRGGPAHWTQRSKYSLRNTVEVSVSPWVSKTSKFTNLVNLLKKKNLRKFFSCFLDISKFYENQKVHQKCIKSASQVHQECMRPFLIFDSNYDIVAEMQ